jgi:hypothetical protein
MTQNQNLIFISQIKLNITLSITNKVRDNHFLTTNRIEMDFLIEFS